MFSSKINQLFLGTLSSVANVALYSVPVRAAGAASTILSKMLQVFYPGFSSMDKEKDAGRIRNIYFSILSIQLFITVPLAIGAILEGQTILAIWINPQFAKEASVIVSPSMPGQIASWGSSYAVEALNPAGPHVFYTGEAYWLFMRDAGTYAGMEVTPFYNIPQFYVRPPFTP